MSNVVTNPGSQGGDSGRMRRASRSRRLAVGVIIGILAIACAAFAFYWRSRPQLPETALALPDEELDEPVVRNPGYVGPEACAACHAERVAEFKATRHYHACRAP